MKVEGRRINLHNKKRDGRGARGGCGYSGITLANTRQTRRILNFIREVNKPMCQTNIAREVLISGAHVKDALNFLVYLGVLRKSKSPTRESYYYEIETQFHGGKNED